MRCHIFSERQQSLITLSPSSGFLHSLFFNYKGRCALACPEMPQMTPPLPIFIRHCAFRSIFRINHPHPLSGLINIQQHHVDISSLTFLSPLYITLLSSLMAMVWCFGPAIVSFCLASFFISMWIFDTNIGLNISPHIRFMCNHNHENFVSKCMHFPISHCMTVSAFTSSIFLR